MRGTKRLNPFFRLHEASEVLSFIPGLSIFMGEIRGMDALLRASSWHVKTVKLHRALSKYIMGVWSDGFTAALYVSFIVTVFVSDIDGIQKKVA